MAMTSVRCWAIECDCGWQKTYRADAAYNGGETPEEVARNKAAKHQRSAAQYRGKDTDRATMRWHQQNPDYVVRVFRAVRIECRSCEYISDACETTGEVAAASAEHEGTVTHRENLEAKGFAESLSRTLRA